MTMVCVFIKRLLCSEGEELAQPELVAAVLHACKYMALKMGVDTSRQVEDHSPGAVAATFNLGTTLPLVEHPMPWQPRSRLSSTPLLQLENQLPKTGDKLKEGCAAGRCLQTFEDACPLLYKLGLGGNLHGCLQEPTGIANDSDSQAVPKKTRQELAPACQATGTSGGHIVPA